MQFQDTSGFTPVTTADLLAGRTLTVLAPHPDDETLGCGNLLATASAMGVPCRIICVTDGTRSHPNSARWPKDALASLRHQEMLAALAVLGHMELHMMGYPDCSAPADGPAVRRLDALIPEGALLLSAWAGDPHIDHQQSARLAATVVRNRPDLHHLAYPVWGRVTPDLPFPAQGWYLTDRSPLKQPALACHRSQMTPLIDDDPDGFVMDPALQTLFLSQPEVFLAP
ncbi:PIG-L deacetylase family protein [Falsirhodobacter sp. alg1]|uniref:PIG-L deacetylase family protein n=1 Tax=Falsirhodobacter sp. alg1 TaxID=1472418 RepID=UPI0005EDD066|nr:PIG-L deacetylase family protein [Falsirhodobacter sp. alg1]